MGGVCADEEFAGHAEVDGEAAAFEFDQDVLAVAADVADGLARDAPGESGGRGAGRKKIEDEDSVSSDMRAEGADDSLDLGQFRHGLIGDLNVDLAVLDGDRVAFDADFGVEIKLAGLAIERPGVPGTEDVAFEEIALAQGGIAVGAEPVESVDGPFVVADGDGLAAGLDVGESAGGEEVDGSNADERHRYGLWSHGAVIRESP